MNSDEAVIKPCLVILAAGVGSRYGGLKQLEPVGPNGEALLDYSVLHALRAGFGKIVLVVREEIQRQVEAHASGTFGQLANVEYVIQQSVITGDGPGNGPGNGPGRRSARRKEQKPFGTGHAVLSAGLSVNSPFAVINADDYYGQSAYTSMFEFLTRSVSENHFAMIGYPLCNTLSANGPVSRAVCEVDKNDLLTGIVEYPEVDWEHAGSLPDNVLVSMNFWGFHPSMIRHLQTAFENFIHAERFHNEEFYLQPVIDNMIATEELRVRVIVAGEQWYGITYHADRASVQAALRNQPCDFSDI